MCKDCRNSFIYDNIHVNECENCKGKNLINKRSILFYKILHESNCNLCRKKFTPTKDKGTVIRLTNSNYARICSDCYEKKNLKRFLVEENFSSFVNERKTYMQPDMFKFGWALVDITNITNAWFFRFLEIFGTSKFLLNNETFRNNKYCNGCLELKEGVCGIGYKPKKSKGELYKKGKNCKMKITMNRAYFYKKNKLFSKRSLHNCIGCKSFDPDREEKETCTAGLLNFKYGEDLYLRGGKCMKKNKSKSETSSVKKSIEYQNEFMLIWISRGKFKFSKFIRTKKEKLKEKVKEIHDTLPTVDEDYFVVINIFTGKK